MVLSFAGLWRKTGKIIYKGFYSKGRKKDRKSNPAGLAAEAQGVWRVASRQTPSFCPNGNKRKRKMPFPAGSICFARIRIFFEPPGK